LASHGRAHSNHLRRIDWPNDNMNPVRIFVLSGAPAPMLDVASAGYTRLHQMVHCRTKPKVSPLSVYMPVTFFPLMAVVSVCGPGSNDANFPLVERTKPWPFRPSLYHPAIAPRALIPTASVKTDPGGSIVEIVPSAARKNP
jgi:hypothetical protein